MRSTVGYGWTSQPSVVGGGVWGAQHTRENKYGRGGRGLRLPLMLGPVERDVQAGGAEVLGLLFSTGWPAWSPRRGRPQTA